jgi:hypothetical protein
VTDAQQFESIIRSRTPEELTPGEYEVIAAELVRIWREDFDSYPHRDMFAGAWNEFMRRIGGPGNVRAYAQGVIAQSEGTHTE